MNIDKSYDIVMIVRRDKDLKQVGKFVIYSMYDSFLSEQSVETLNKDWQKYSALVAIVNGVSQWHTRLLVTFEKELIN